MFDKDKRVNPLTMNLSLSDFSHVSCPKCQNEIFDMFYKIMRLSALKSPSGKEQFIHLPVYVCASCGAILDETESVSEKQETSNEIVK